MLTPRPKIQDCKSLEDLINVDKGTIADRVHIIIDSQARCACGVYGGHSMGCADILMLHFPDIKDAIIGNSFGGQPIMVETEAGEGR